MSYALYSFCVTIISIVAIIYLNRSLSNPDVSSEKECSETPLNKGLDINKLKDGDPCDVWDGSSCRRGQVSGLLCVAQRSYLMLFLLFLLFTSFVASLYFYFFSSKPEPEAPKLGFSPYRFKRV